MKPSTFVSSALVLAASRAVLVTETDYNYFTVTVIEGAPSANAAQPAPTSSEAASPSAAESVGTSWQTSWSTSAGATNNYVWVPPTPSSSGSNSVLSSSSSSSSTSSTPPPPPAPTTSSSTPAPAAPSTTSTSSTSSAPETESSTVAPPPSATSPPATTTSSEPAPTSTSAPNGFASDIVDYHNKVRAEHQVGPVTWSQKLADYAQQYLNGDNCVFKHSGGPYGENIALGYNSNDDAMSAWYDEYKDYDYAAGQFSESTGHFTQMVWKGTNEVGCATVDCSGRTFLACEYYPRGNIIGHFTENVFN